DEDMIKRKSYNLHDSKTSLAEVKPKFVGLCSFPSAP
ncbi:unnamed protein product, partial [marine sediment metagenome]